MGDMLSALAGFAKDNNFDTKEISKAKENQGKRKSSDTNRNKEKKDYRNTNQYVGAPYNFVSQWDVVEKSKEDCIRHDVLDNELISGEITYRMSFETEVMVGADSFCRNPYGTYAIPGSTVRGLIRSHAQVLGLSSIADDIDDYALMFREVGGKKGNPNKETYGRILGSGQINHQGKTVSVLKNVKAGYIANEGSEYKIYQTKVDKINQSLGAINFYIINERQVQRDSKKELYPFFWTNVKCLQHDLRYEFKRIVRGNRIHYVGTENKAYIPYYKDIKYQIQGERNVVYIGEKDSSKGLHGVMIGTGKMNEKKCHYIIPEIDRNKPVLILNQKDVEAFRIDYNHKKNQLKGSIGRDTSFFDLPKKGEVRPVFYIQQNGRTYFGYTPRLRLFYKHNIKDGLISSQKNSNMDYVKALFGYSGKENSYKTRVSFSDALLQEGKLADSREVILGEPSASSYNDYLEVQKNGQASTYNRDGFRLRGAKQYWLRNSVIPGSSGKNHDVGTQFCPMDKGAVFEGKIRFHNLTEAEVGLLLWCIRLNPTSRLQVGKGKPYGYGRARAEIISVKELDVAKAYSSEAFSLSPFRMVAGQDIEEYANKKISLYKKEINGRIHELHKGGRIDDLPSIKEFFAMRDASTIVSDDRIRYMSLDKREYQNREPLKDVFETLNG